MWPDYGDDGDGGDGGSSYDQDNRYNSGTQFNGDVDVEELTIHLH